MVQKNALRKKARVRSNHPLVGTWEQEPNPYLPSTARFTITVTDGRFVVSGVDESDKNAFEISNTRWHGKALCFTRLFPPTKHRAKHVLRIIGKARISHEVSYIDEEGSYSDREVWRKSIQKSNLGRRM